MVYADWIFYTTEFLKGDTPTLTETNFERWAEKASRRIDEIVMFSGVKISDPPQDKISMATCELAEFMFDTKNQAKRSGTKILPKGLSISRGKEAEQTSIIDQEYNIVARRLTGTGFLFRGVG